MDTLNVEGTHCDDPQFIEVLIVCLHKEIAVCRQILNAHEAEGKKVKGRVCAQVSIKKELREKIKETKESVLTLISINRKLDKRIKKTVNRISLLKVNTDDKYRINLLEMEQYQILLDEYKSIWNNYNMQYEQFMLAKTRNKESIKWQSFYIDRMIIEHKIEISKKILCKMTNIDWIRQQTMIIDLCGLLDKRLERAHILVNLKKSIYSYREEYRLIKAQLKKQLEDEAEQERIRTQNLLEMPPPKMALSNIYSKFMHKNQWTEISAQWKWNKIAGDDSASVNSILLEEMTIIDEDSLQICKEPDHFERKDDSVVPNAPGLETDGTIYYRTNSNHSSNIEIKQTQSNITKHSDIVDTNKQLTLVSNNEEKSDKHKEQYLSGHTEINTNEADRYTKENSGEPLKSEEDPLKRKLPQIKKVENVYLDLSKQMSTKINSTNLFSPHHYEYCDSNFTQSLGIDTRNREEDFSTFEEPVNNPPFSECSNISPILNNEDDKNAEAQNALDSTAKTKSQQEDGKTFSSPQFTFTDILKKKPTYFQIF